MTRDNVIHLNSFFFFFSKFLKIMESVGALNLVVGQYSNLQTAQTKVVTLLCGNRAFFLKRRGGSSSKLFNR